MSIKLKIEGEIFEVDPRYAEVSGLIEVLVKQSAGEEAFELSSQIVTKEIFFQYIKKYYEFNSFKPQEITEASKDPSKLFWNEHDRDLIMPVSPLEGTLLQRLVQAATYLQMRAFKKLCLARIMLEFYFDRSDPQRSLEDLKKKFKDVPALTLQDVESYKEKYPQLVNEFK
ncbi:hypothetical protein pb186bvf_009589 [Paramecium bursaria]